jgi:hypothetical protein
VSSSLADEDRAVLVFGEASAAEAFHVIEGLGQEWEVIEYAPPEAAEVLYHIISEGIAHRLGIPLRRA